MSEVLDNKSAFLTCSPTLARVGKLEFQTLVDDVTLVLRRCLLQMHF